MRKGARSGWCNPFRSVRCGRCLVPEFSLVCGYARERKCDHVLLPAIAPLMKYPSVHIVRKVPVPRHSTFHVLLSRLPNALHRTSGSRPIGWCAHARVRTRVCASASSGGLARTDTEAANATAHPVRRVSGSNPSAAWPIAATRAKRTCRSN
jgi:hypothetical protein